jgi:hypothetical protein
MAVTTSGRKYQRLTDVESDSKRPRDTRHWQPMESGAESSAMCQDGHLCRMLDADVVLKGKGSNGAATK